MSERLFFVAHGSLIAQEIISQSESQLTVASLRDEGRLQGYPGTEITFTDFGEILTQDKLQGAFHYHTQSVAKHMTSMSTISGDDILVAINDARTLIKTHKAYLTKHILTPEVIMLSELKRSVEMRGSSQAYMPSWRATMLMAHVHYFRSIDADLA